MLLQTDVSRIDRPVAYFSKKLDRHQKQYSTIEKEALALVLAVQHFEVYVSSAGGDLVVLTNHNPLTFLAKLKMSSQRVFCWNLILQPHNLMVLHLPGKEMLLQSLCHRDADMRWVRWKSWKCNHNDDNAHGVKMTNYTIHFLSLSNWWSVITPVWLDITLLRYILLILRNDNIKRIKKTCEKDGGWGSRVRQLS